MVHRGNPYPNQSRRKAQRSCPAERVCDGKGKTRSSVNVAVLVPPHDLMALFWHGPGVYNGFDETYIGSRAHIP